MAKDMLHNVKTYRELYAYFKANPKTYRMTKSQELAIKVELLGPSGDPLKFTAIHPVEHQKICVHYFHDVEVSNPDVVIPEIVIKDIIYHLCVPKEIFWYYS